MKLSLVIPVWNDLPGLDRLLRQVSELGVFAEIFVVDDASDEPAGPSTVPAAAAVADRLTWLRSAQRRGAGHARNLALERVSGDHVIFLTRTIFSPRTFLPSWRLLPLRPGPLTS
ncbi:glycosyltransferase family 2 protein [Paracoccus kondratievae]